MIGSSRSRRSAHIVGSIIGLVVMIACTACAAPSGRAPVASRTQTTAARATAARASATAAPSPTHTSSGSSRRSTTSKGCTASSRTWKGHRRFYTDDRACYTSPWFAGTHKIMIGFGCNTSPWYPKAAACRYRGGIHHGIDIDMPVGTDVRSAVSGTAYVRPSTMGGAYGRHGLLIRSGGRDYVLGHLSKLKVRNGQHVKAGQLIARSGMSGVESEDGPHLHFELRPAKQGYRTAVKPRKALRLTARA